MNNLPTAEEFLKNKVYITKDDIEDVHDSLITVTNTMIEFAKLHVEAALKNASEKAKMQTRNKNKFDELNYNIIHKQSILNAYPLDNIK
jgi:hypothetical protein